MPGKSRTKRQSRRVSPRETEIILRFMKNHENNNADMNMALLLRTHFTTLSKELGAVRERGEASLKEVQVARKIRFLKGVEKNCKIDLARTNELGTADSLEPTAIEGFSNSEAMTVQMGNHRQPIRTITRHTKSPATTEQDRIVRESTSRDNVWSPDPSEGDLGAVQALSSSHQRILERYGLDEQRPWQECLYSSWRSYLQREGHALLRSHEPLDSETVENDTGKITSLVKVACQALLEALPYCWMLNVEPALIDGFTHIMTGNTGQQALNELKALQACHPSFLRIDLCCALAGSAVYKWVFGESGTPVRVMDTSNYATRITMEFIENECPNLWKDYISLHRQYQRSGDDSNHLSQRATRLTNQLYNVFECSHLSTVQQSSTESICDGGKLSSEKLKTMEVRYNGFLSHMTQAMMMALTLRNNLEKCSELKYHFKFPRIRAPFDPYEMQVRDNECCAQIEEHRPIAISLFPSIWTSIEGKEKSARMLSKAIVIL